MGMEGGNFHFICLCNCDEVKLLRQTYIPGVDPGFYVRGRTSWRGVWGPPRSQSDPGQCPVGVRPPEAHGN
jgi:hypothetical protein